MSGRTASPSKRSIFPTLRFRAKIILGFAAVLVISAGSMAFAYFGFERVSSGVGSYRSSVSEADLARNIDRELLAYRSAVKYFVVTGKEDDAKAALDAEASLKSAIDQAVKSAKTPARQDSLDKLAKEFSNFSATFAKVLQAKRDSTLLVQNQLSRQANLLKYKLDDIGNNASDSEAQAIEFGTKQVNAQFQTASAAATNFVLTSDQAIATSALARLKFVENSLGAVYSMDDKIVAGLKDAKAHARRLSRSAGEADRQRQDGRRSRHRDERLGGRDPSGRHRDEGGPGRRTAAAGVRNRKRPSGRPSNWC